MPAPASRTVTVDGTICQPVSPPSSADFSLRSFSDSHRIRLQVVRGRAILDCLAHAGEAWARAALEHGAPHALPLRTEGP